MGKERDISIKYNFEGTKKLNFFLGGYIHITFRMGVKMILRKYHTFRGC